MMETTLHLMVEKLRELKGAMSAGQLELKAEISGVKSEMSASQEELKTDLSVSQGGIKNYISAVKNDIEDKIQNSISAMETQTGNLHCLGTSQYISCMFNVYN
jgi:hypothetical protein